MPSSMLKNDKTLASTHMLTHLLTHTLLLSLAHLFSPTSHAPLRENGTVLVALLSKRASCHPSLPPNANKERIRFTDAF